MMDYLESLNAPQLEAVTNTDGPCMLIAGAGSGKTRVLTYRIAQLMGKGVDPFNIMALTFTNKAAKEMRNRIEKVMGHDARNVWMGTFHSVFARILRAEAQKRSTSAIHLILRFTIQMIRNPSSETSLKKWDWMMLLTKSIQFIIASLQQKTD